MSEFELGLPVCYYIPDPDAPSELEVRKLTFAERVDNAWSDLIRPRFQAVYTGRIKGGNNG